jgi:type IV pilus assembly protein PilY1
MSYRVSQCVFLPIADAGAVAMKLAGYLLLLCVLAGTGQAAADDTDAWLPGGWREDVYLHVVMDTGDAAQDAVLCTYGIDCGPPFMTESAHRHLAAMYTVGEPVTAPGVFRAVFAAVIAHSRFDAMHLSLLISNHQDNRPPLAATGLGGGTVLAGYQQIGQRRAELVALLGSIPRVVAPAAHVLQPKETYFEWLRYIRGGEVALGQNTAGNFGRADPYPNYDTGIINSGRYIAPIDNEYACPTLLSILFTPSSQARDDDLDAEISAQLALPAQTSFTRFMSYLHNPATDLLPQVATTVPLTSTWVVTSRARAADVEEQAVAGRGTVMYVDNPVQLEEDLNRALAAFVDVRSVTRSAVFVDDVFHRGKILDDVFLPMFAPRAGIAWPGNLKKLKLGRSGGDGSPTAAAPDALYQMVDAHGQPAIELTGSDKGRLRADALTFWTDAGSLPAGDGRSVPDSADGGVVTRGGAGQKIDGFVPYSDGAGEQVHYFIGDTNTDAPVGGYPPRQVFYEPAAGQDFVAFNADAPTVASLKPLLDPGNELSADALLRMIRWARGQDTNSADVRARDWLLGGLLHSRPLALNYGATPGYSAANPQVRLLFGSGDGAFRIVENTDASSRQSGRELFAFYPRQAMATIRAQYEASWRTAMRHYGVDGSPVVLKRDRNGDGTIAHADGDQAIVYFGMRRGGASYFALDVSNPDELPRLLWKISPTSGGEFDELGLTFSTPLVGKVNFNGVAEDVLVFAGGYSGGWNEDATARVGKDAGAEDDAIGNAIYVVNARSGELVWKAMAGNTGARSNTHYAHAGLVDSIPSAVSALVTSTGIVHRLYVGDSGGAVWRVDLPPAESADANHRRDHWFITKLADLGSDAGEPGGTVAADRRFFHAPDIVQSFDGVGNFDGVLIQSGNPADPNETAVENALFYLKDRITVSGSAALQAGNETNQPSGRYRIDDLVDRTTCIAAPAEQAGGEDDGACSEAAFPNGWAVRFLEPGEKGLSSPVTDAGRVFASTFVPGDATRCPVRQGHGRLHVLRLADATAVANQQRVYELGEGVPEGAEQVGDLLFLPGGGVDLYDLDGDGSRDTTNLLPSRAVERYRTYWREPGVDSL